MGAQTPSSAWDLVWRLAQRQHFVATRAQLLECGLTPKGIRHWVAQGRLHPIARGVFAVGRRDLTAHGLWMAVVLRCGSGAVLSHTSAAALWEITSGPTRRPQVTVPRSSDPRPQGITVHRRSALRASDLTRRHRIPVTTPVCTLVDIATQLDRDGLEAAVSEAHIRGLARVDALERALDSMPPRPGLAVLRDALDPRTFRPSRSWLERRFLPLVRGAGLPLPKTLVHVNGFEVDAFWPELGLVVEIDGLSFHRTAAQQAKDRRRDQAHTAAGLTQLRYAREQVVREPEHVQATLATVAARLGAARTASTIAPSAS